MTIKNKKVIKITIIVLMSLLFFFSIKFIKSERELAAFKSTAELEANVLQSQLDAILIKYDSLSEISKQQISKTKSSLVNSGPNNKIDIDAMLKDSLEYYSKKAEEISTQIKLRDNQAAKKVVLSNKHRDSGLSCLETKNINVKGVKIFTDNFKKGNASIQQLRVCFTLLPNEVVNAGSKKIYIQVVNPKNQIISKGNLSINSDAGKMLKYSAVAEVVYDNVAVDVCDFVDLESNKTIKGTYLINIYSEFVKIGSTTFEY